MATKDANKEIFQKHFKQNAKEQAAAYWYCGLHYGKTFVKLPLELFKDVYRILYGNAA